MIKHFLDYAESSQQSCFRASQSECRSTCLYPSDIGYTHAMYLVSWVTDPHGKVWPARLPCTTSTQIEYHLKVTQQLMVCIAKKAFKCHQTLSPAWGVGSGKETNQEVVRVKNVWLSLDTLETVVVRQNIDAMHSKLTYVGISTLFHALIINCSYKQMSI